MSKPIRDLINNKAYILDRIIIDDGGCWVWQLSRNPRTGYGQIGYYPYTAHRLAFFLWKGEPSGEVLRHSCHNTACCNPEHLSDGTHYQNWHDSEETQAIGASKRRGRVASNAKPVVVGDQRFSSIAEAMREMKLGHATVVRMMSPPGGI